MPYRVGNGVGAAWLAAKKGKNHRVGSGLTGAAARLSERPRRCKIEMTVPRLRSKTTLKIAALARSGLRWRLPAAWRSPAAAASPRPCSAATCCRKARSNRSRSAPRQEQVLIVLGTPSTVATVSGEAFYYISQTSRARGGVHALRGQGPARDRGLFRQGPPGRAARQLRPQGRQGVRLRVADDADRRQGRRTICATSSRACAPRSSGG